jgi:putative transcriptional regulator
MSEETTIVAKRQSDGTLLQVLPDGATKPLEDKTDWQRLRDMTEDESLAAALADPDAQPLTDEAAARMRRVPRARTLRRALGLTQEEFATRYRIPIGTLRDWEQGRAEPDEAARAYLKAIAGNPDAVQEAFRSGAREGSDDGAQCWARCNFGDQPDRTSWGKNDIWPSTTSSILF